ncbi:unnamed protein product, partial [Urochloa humidicola]
LPILVLALLSSPSPNPFPLRARIPSRDPDPYRNPSPSVPARATAAGSAPIVTRRAARSPWRLMATSCSLGVRRTKDAREKGGERAMQGNYLTHRRISASGGTWSATRTSSTRDFETRTRARPMDDRVSLMARGDVEAQELAKPAQPLDTA